MAEKYFLRGRIVNHHFRLDVEFQVIDVQFPGLESFITT